MYAIPSYVDDNTPTIKRNAMNLLEGPKSKNNEIKSPSPTDKNKRSSKRNYIIFGHYENPTMESMFDSIGSKDNKQLSVRSENSLWRFKDDPTNQEEKIIMPDDHHNRRKNIVIKANNVSLIKDDEIAANKKKYGLLKTSTLKFKNWFDNEENKIMKLLMVILIGIVITMFWYFHTTVRELRQQSQNGSKTNVPRSTDSNGSYGVESLDGGKRVLITSFSVEILAVSVIIVNIRLIVYFVHWMINNRLVYYFQMFLECANHDHKINF